MREKEPQCVCVCVCAGVRLERFPCVKGSLDVCQPSPVLPRQPAVGGFLGPTVSD